MGTNQGYLFKDKRFLPLFITQFFGCFNDNILKNALTTIITYESVQLFGLTGALLALVAHGLFIIPFVILAGLAGQIADKYERAYLIRIIKAVEIGITALVIYGFYYNNLVILFFCLLLMGIHSTFFGPLKYSVLPDHLNKDELLAANGYIDAGTFLSILIGTLFGTIYDKNSTLLFLAALMMSSAIAGFVSSLFIPKSGNSNPEIEINPNFLQENINILKYSYSKKQVFLSILGISWFWFIGGTFLSQIPFLVKDILGADKTVVNLFLATFSIGVGIGSVLANKVLNNEITTKYIVLAALGISLFGIDLYFGSGISAVKNEPTQLIDFVKFLSKKNSWRILLDLLFLSALGGFYIVPLYAVMQYFSSPTHRSRVIAANNIVNSAFMVASTLLISVLLKAGLSVQSVILFISILNVGVSIYIHSLVNESKIIPDSFLRLVFRTIFDKIYRVEVKGIENYHKAGKRTVIISNHISYLDPALLAVYLPEKLTFAINTEVAKLWWVRPFLKIGKAYPVDPSNAMSAKTLISEVKKNKKMAIFPEGRITVTGSLMKVYEGPGMIADKADATILPIRIDGPQYTYFSKLKNFPRPFFFPKIIITILPPERITAPEELDSRSRRKYISQRLYDIMADMMFESSDYRKNLFQSLIDAAKTHDASSIIVRDIDNNNLSYRNFLMRVFILSRILSRRTAQKEFVGLMLPNSSTTAAAFFALQAIGRVPTMINFSSGIANILSCCKTADIKIIYTSRRFISKAALDELVDRLKEIVKVVYLEDERTKISLKDKLVGLAASFMPQSYYNHINYTPSYDDPAVVLFTSGTEGKPKAVVLSHKNIQSNRCQIAALVDFGKHDIAFNALPMFHSFGLTAGTILPILAGIQTFFYPSPLHYRIVPEIIYDIGATIMFGTDTFLNGYAKFAHPYDFYSIRYVFAGAEKLRPETRKVWFDKYGVRIFEGYGATETAPVISVNTPMHDRPGTVGRIIPGMEYFIKPVEGITEGGSLCVRGPNVMLGYMFHDNPGVVSPPSVEKLGEGWYDTGDIVTFDEEGYITIKGRAKRFAKIAGEMISLAAIEELVSATFPEGPHATISISDSRKGEQVILFTVNPHVTREKLVESLKQKKLSELLLPKHIFIVNEVPVFNTGKVNYPALIEKSASMIPQDNPQQDNPEQE
jgi:acyl-[acyl-carrier-protein]-phospholipid O-acyltransferase/long-chain-fatty-acid--[acyl-carrier-protein] ligase